MSEEKYMRLNQAARHYNIATSKIVEIITSKGLSIENNPNFKLGQKHIDVLNEELNNKQNDTVNKKIGLSVVSKIDLNTKTFNPTKKNTMQSPIQKILFGSPGTGKSFKIDNEYIKNLKIDKDSENCIKTVFHPEYTYGDFMGKLLPLSNDEGKVSYKFYEGHFLKALAQAYKNILDKKEDEEPKNVVLVIDEINRGNSATIFGSIFQLLDREEEKEVGKGWSSYSISISEMEFNSLIKLIGIEIEETKKGSDKTINYVYPSNKQPLETIMVKNKKIKVPPNLSIIATMNTSDNSIYFMDSAFKRRWDWEFIDIEDILDFTDFDNKIEFTDESWKKFIKVINNDLIKSNGDKIRRIEDKQIGYYFIKQPITGEKLRNKLMFFLWDSVFTNDKKPLAEFIGVDKKEIITFGDFIRKFKEFYNVVLSK